MNLVSAIRLNDEDYKSSIWNDTLKFCKGNLIVFQAQKTNTLYVMHAWLFLEEANVAIGTTGELWHKRLCQMSEKGIRKLVVDDLIPEEKNVQLAKCTYYLAGKQNRISF